jgi:hydroxymethylbilane synthase
LKPLRLGSRGSQLALFQARLVAARIQAAGGPPSEIVIIKTSGDRLQEAPLSEVGGKRLFVKEIEDALSTGDIDLAVHSAKDMPAALPEDLEVAAVLPREDPSDALILPAGRAVEANDLDGIRALLGEGARIGTGSARRVAQLRHALSGAAFRNVRGNIDTRLRKLDAGEHDALVLAAAGLRRLGFASRISLAIPTDVCVPAPGQGIIAVEIRSDDAETRSAVERISDPPTFDAFDAERALVVALGGGCQMPIGGLARSPTGSDPAALELHAVVASLDGERIIRYKKVGAQSAAGALGREVAEQLLAAGAADILAESRAADSEPRQLT